MSLKTLLNPQFTSYVVTLVAASGVMTLAAPALAQTVSVNPLPLHMAQATPELTGNWRLANMTEDPFPTPMVPAGELTAEFAGDRVSGTGGCNRFMGDFQTDGDQLNVGPLASTFMACEDAVMAQEMRYLKALEGAQRFEINNQGLTIYYQTPQASGVLRYVPLQAQTQPVNPQPRPVAPQPQPVNPPPQAQPVNPRPSEPVRALW